MSKANVRRHILEKNRSPKEKEPKPTQSLLSKHLKKVYPIGLHRSSSSLSLSSLSLSLSQNSNDSSVTDNSNSPLEQRISLALRLITPPERREVTVAKNAQPQQQQQQQQQQSQDSCCGELKRCNWITKNSDKVYVAFHDECWGVPVYDDNQLFELLALSGMLMDYNWTEILKRKELFREAFGGFDPKSVAKMGEKEILEISSNTAIMLAECRILNEFGSFSSFMWGYVNFKPMINKFRYPRNVPLRSPKAEAISRDLLKRGFRLVGPVIVYSFMQAAGLTIDHLVDCFRYSECVSLAERPWRHI
ncbi:DNA glycosylase superfamily protein [Citrus sinensis]|uniref:DNA glycosylase superfamily protein n=1 Tax=Citrus sinensis TaxID=2711 RepID=A0ACB8LFE7_CITSI|nr:DNA glycosylase superfamily protein [Citrus sinensis]